MQGDTWIDDHHTVEDIALALGSAMSQVQADTGRHWPLQADSGVHTSPDYAHIPPRLPLLQALGDRKGIHRFGAVHVHTSPYHTSRHLPPHMCRLWAIGKASIALVSSRPLWTRR